MTRKGSCDVTSKGSFGTIRKPNNNEEGTLLRYEERCNGASIARVAGMGWAGLIIVHHLRSVRLAPRLGLARVQCEVGRRIYETFGAVKVRC